MNSEQRRDYPLSDFDVDENMAAEQFLADHGCEGMTFLVNYSYNSAIIGVTHDDRIVYEYDKMVEYLMEKQNWTDLEAIEWIETNVIPSIGYMNPNPPVILYRFEENE